MAHRTRGRLARQIHAARERLDHDDELPFAQLLDADTIRQALPDDRGPSRNRLYPAWVTVWVFLSQVLDANQCCLQAVLRFLAYRRAHGLSACSSATGGYCQARQRLAESTLQTLVQTTGRDLHDDPAHALWRWKGRVVQIVDGTTVSMPDTPANQAAYPQPSSQKPGVGFPLARLIVVFSLAVGTVLEMALGAHQGKQTGELSLWRTLHDRLEPDDVVLADRLFGSYFDLAMLRERSVDGVMRLHQNRRADFRTGERLGPNDQIVTWTKPDHCPDWMDRDTYDRLPATLRVRYVRVPVTIPGFRTRSLVVVTTLLDATTYSAAELADLYRARWQAELHLRSLKTTLQMDGLRGHTPEMVRKEIWVHLLAYNLIRRVMASAAQRLRIAPLAVSFASAVQAVLAFAPYLVTGGADLYETLLREVGRHRIGDRPPRYEPRAKKRRPKAYRKLQQSRTAARKRCRNGHNG